jgi:nucleoside 2-deoxyribosyltransferase
MKVYFACSITGGREDELVYQAIVETLLAGGHQVPTAHLAHPDVMDLEAVVDPEEVYTRDINWMNASDALIAEVSTPSHGVGFEVSHALGREIPVLCCYRQGKRVSKMLTGNTSPYLRVDHYRSSAEAVQLVTDFLASIDSK